MAKREMILEKRAEMLASQKDPNRLLDRNAGKRLLEEEGVEVLTVSPPCTVFSNLQHMNPVGVTAVEWNEACSKLDHSIEMCRLQMALERGFVFEHPLTASSWHHESLKKLREDPRVWTVEVHMCAYGMWALDEQGEGAVMKPTRLLTNIEPVAWMMCKRCSGDHRHVNLVGGRASGAAAYPQGFCADMLTAINIWTKAKK